MKKILIIVITLLSLGVQAQMYEIIPQQVHRESLCYENKKAHSFQEKRIDEGGEVFNLIMEGDVEGENIVLGDKDELQKLSDRINYEIFGLQGEYNRAVDWKLMKILFGTRISTQQAILSYLQEGSFHLLCYGFSDQKYNSVNRIILDGKEIDVKRTARIIMKELEDCDIITKYTKRPIVVVIHACGVGGKSRNSFASRLSRHLAKKSLNIYVVAAPGNIHPSVSRWPSYTETVIDDKGIVVNWNCFHRGRIISEGESDFATTILKIQNEYLR